VAATGAQVLVTVDNGIASLEGVQAALALGLQVLVTDHHLPAQALEHKPVLLCGVSAGDGGAYPVMDMRAYSFKNFRPCYLPEQLIVRKVREEFLEVEESGVRSLTFERADYCLRLLQAYATGFETIRGQLPERAAAFAYGV